MRVIQVNTVYGVKSTGRTCLELEKYLIKNGHDCVTAYGCGEIPSKGSNTYRINTRFEYLVHNLLSRITGLEGYFSFFATLRLIRFMNKYEPDIVHLRNLHGHYLNFPLFFKYLKRKQLPVVVHMHDCWISTGKCTYPIAYQCDRWQILCKNCPARNDYPQSYVFDYSKKMFRDKKRWFYALPNVRVVGVSKWVAGEGAKSYLNKFPVSYIYNWINTSVFYPRESDIAKEYNLDEKKFNIICVSAHWGNKKKYSELLQLSEQIDESMHMIVVGRCKKPILKSNVTYIPFVDNVNELAKLYSFGDVYVHFSQMDTFGKVIAEALACGIPAIVYNCTACPEVIGKNCGYAVEPHNILEICDRLQIVKENGKSYYSDSCLNWVRNNFDYHTNCQQTVQLYYDMIAGKL